MLAVEGYDVVLLPVVLGSAGTLFKCLDRATKEWTFLMPEKETIQQVTSSQHTQSTKPSVPTPILGKTKANLRSKGERQIASLPTPTCPYGQAVKPASPFTPNSVYLYFISLLVS
jgi:hypothetical protein